MTEKKEILGPLKRLISEFVHSRATKKAERARLHKEGKKREMPTYENSNRQELAAFQKRLGLTGKAFKRWVKRERLERRVKAGTNYVQGERHRVANG